MSRLIWVFAGHTCQFVDFLMRRLICLESLMGCAMYWRRGRATKSYKTWGTQIGSDSSVSKMICFTTSYKRCHAGLSCTSDEYPPVCINWWLSRFPGLRWFHRVFPGYMAETYIGFPPSQDRPPPPPCNTHSVKCYAPVICNHVSYGPEE